MAHSSSGHLRALCVAALALATAGEASAGSLSMSGRYNQRQGLHSVVTVGNGSSPGGRTLGRQAVRTVTRTTARLTPERPADTRPGAANALRASADRARKDSRLKRVELVNKNTSPPRSDVSTANKGRAPTMHEVWTTKGDKAK